MSARPPWGIYGHRARIAVAAIRAMWDAGRDTDWIAKFTQISEAQIYGVTSAYVTAKKFRKDRF